MNQIDLLDKRFIELVRKHPKTVEEIAETENVRTELERELNQEEQELLKDLSLAGLQVSSVWDLVNTKDRYPTAIPILIKHLPNSYHNRIKEGIIRALTVREAKGKAAPVLITEYEKTPKEEDNLRWVIGNAIATVMTLQDVKWILSAVADKSNKRSRRQLVKALGTVKSEKVEDALINLLDDDEVASEALWGLARLKSQKAKEKIILLAKHPNKQINIEAQRALKRIN